MCVHKRVRYSQKNSLLDDLEENNAGLSTSWSAKGMWRLWKNDETYHLMKNIYRIYRNKERGALTQLMEMDESTIYHIAEKSLNIYPHKKTVVIMASMHTASLNVQ